MRHAAAASCPSLVQCPGSAAQGPEALADSGLRTGGGGPHDPTSSPSPAPRVPRRPPGALDGSCPPAEGASRALEGRTELVKGWTFTLPPRPTPGPPAPRSTPGAKAAAPLLAASSRLLSASGPHARPGVTFTPTAPSAPVDLWVTRLRAGLSPSPGGKHCHSPSAAVSHAPSIGAGFCGARCGAGRGRGE